MQVVLLLTAASACGFPKLPELTADAGGDDDAPTVDASPDAQDLSDCPPGYAMIAGAGTHRYKLMPTSSAWITQRDACGADGTHLAVPRASGELSAVVTLSATGRTWIGISDLQVEANYVTVGGYHPTYVPWEAGEPDNGTSMQQDCVSALSTGAIATDVCTAPFAAVCECDNALTFSLVNLNDGDTGISRTADIIVRFNSSVVPSTITGIQVKVGGSPFSGYSLMLSANDSQLTIHWTGAGLPATSTLQLIFPVTIQDTQGRPLEQAVTLNFTTGA